MPSSHLAWSSFENTPHCSIPWYICKSKCHFYLWVRVVYHIQAHASAGLWPVFKVSISRRRTKRQILSCPKKISHARHCNLRACPLFIETETRVVVFEARVLYHVNSKLSWCSCTLSVNLLDWKERMIIHWTVFVFSWLTGWYFLSLVSESKAPRAMALYNVTSAGTPPPQLQFQV